MTGHPRKSRISTLPKAQRRQPPNEKWERTTSPWDPAQLTDACAAEHGRPGSPDKLAAVAAVGYLLVIGERDALAWVLTTQRMAVPDYRSREVSALEPGDQLFLYTTRGCFHNPTRDRGRVVGVAKATTD